MNYMDKIFERMDLQQVCNFLTNELEFFDIKNDTYENRLKKGSDSIYKRLEEIYKNEEERDQALTDLADALIAYESVYTEIGMKFGARLIHQLLHVGNPVKFGKEK